MSVTTRGSLALAAALVATLVVVAPAAAHAEFVSSEPAPDSEVEGPFAGPIELTFDEPLGDGSHAELVGSDGSEIADATIPADAPAQLVFELAGPLRAGAYEVRWTTVGQDGEIDRGTFTITVAEPEPTPPPTPVVTDTEGPSPSPQPSASPTLQPSPSPSGDGGSGAAAASDVLLPIIVAIVVIAALGAVLLRNRRRPT
jgi:methionine-rich copper-binding protein CopC